MPRPSIYDLQQIAAPASPRDLLKYRDIAAMRIILYRFRHCRRV